MVTPFAIDLPEIRNHIAEHLSKKELLACCRVAKDWHSSFLPYLWQSVVFNGAGPIFSNTDTDRRVVNIRRLRYNYSTFEGPMPTQGYTRLKELEIHQEPFETEFELLDNGSQGGCAGDLWHLPIALVHSLANGPLSSVEITNIDRACPELWVALAQCHSLKSLRLCDPQFQIGQAGAPFWKVCRSVETLELSQCRDLDCLVAHPGMFRFKHLAVDGSDIIDGRDDWETVKPWFCSPNLETLKYTDSRTSYCEDEFHELVLYIKAAIAAAAEGTNFYAPVPDNNDLDVDNDMEKYRGLIPGRKLHSVETDIEIEDEDLGFIINNMDALRKLCTPINVIGPVTIEALGGHRHTIAELDLSCGTTNSCQILNMVKSCAQLKVVTLSSVDVGAFVQSDDAWACLGLKRLDISFRKQNVMQDPQGALAVWQQLSSLIKLEDLRIYMLRKRDDWLQQLNSLTELRSIDIDMLTLEASDASWMVEAWPRLELVRGQHQPEDHFDIDIQVVQTFKDKGISVEAPEGYGPGYMPL